MNDFHEQYIGSLRRADMSVNTALAVASEICRTREPKVLAWIAARSYGHPNGFRKLVVAEYRGFVLRLHIWPPGFTNSDPHSHRWDFCSYILRGTLYQSLFKEDTDLDAFYAKCKAISPNDGNGTYTHAPVCRVGLRRTQEAHLCEGSAYWLHHGSAHQVGVPQSARFATVSLMLTEPASRDHSFMYALREVPVGEVVSVRSLSADEVADDFGALAL